MGNAAADIVQSAELGDLLSGVVRGIVQAQGVLDQAAAQAATQYVNTPDGQLSLPPLWYTVKSAEVDVQMSATVQNGEFICRLTNSSSVALFGYQASAAARVRLVIGPNGLAQVKSGSAGS